MRALRVVVAAVALCIAAPALAHAGHEHDAPGWTWDAWIAVPTALSLILYTIGWRRLRARSQRGRVRLDRAAASFGLGWLALVAALVSPLHEAGERSFTMHMIEHEMLMIVAAPLLVLGRPMAMMLWAFPGGGRRVLGNVAQALAVPFAQATGCVTATVIQAAALWLWHAPALFDRALASESWHAVQHLSFVISALLFWTAMLGRGRGQGLGLARERAGTASHSSGATAALCLFATSIVTGALGALMAVSASPWYAGYARLGMAPFGLSPVEDQQLAGAIMWVPGGVVHAVAALVLVRALLRGGETRRTADAL
ncbi:MAG TPA: cytochrome c oxidase assembly protein [Sphingomonas sp.]|jgi:cytochrome c oxidase assembly factor CtaG|nr:cytochrome c oxidase assembly protein [Sphingomonas sp.]